MQSQTREAEIVVCGVPFETPHEDEALRRLADIGVTSVQIYTFWNKFEPEQRGLFDWRYYDREVELIQKAGLRYVPFLLMGPKYAAPRWWLQSDRHVGLYCLEHGQYNPVESIWNHRFREEISRVLAEFAAHYLPANVLESVQPGICGDYGESIMPVHGNWPGDYHTHQGYWCAGQDARVSLRTWLRDKFEDIRVLNGAWRSRYRDFGDVEPFLPHQAPSRTAYFDLLDWYRWSMTEYVQFWMAELRKFFPGVPLYLCTGGAESPEHASSFSAQAMVCARYAGGIRLTNEGNKFYDNFVVTALCKSACDYYGAYLGLEPVGPMTDQGVITRIFGSAAYGNRQIFHYYDNLFERYNGTPRPAATAVKQYGHLIRKRDLPESVAVFWPEYYTAGHGGIPDDLKQSLRFIRMGTNCLPINEGMILDGALKRHRLLIVPVAGFTRREVLRCIVDWVWAGGVVFTFKLTRDLELNAVPEYDAIFGILPRSERAMGIATQRIAPTPEFPAFSRVGSFVSSQGWMGLADDVRILASTEEGPSYAGTYTCKVSAAFLRRAGAGVAIDYEGPVTFESDPDAIFPDPGVYKALLSDVVRQYARTTDLTPDQDEIARAEIDGKIYALREDGIITL